MSETKHTPGPWEVEEHENGDIETSVCGLVKTTYRSGPSGGLDLKQMKEEALANARLIAAAPDLLGALQDCYSELVKVMSVHSFWAGGNPRLFGKCEAAIAKATGAGIEDEEAR